MGRSATNTGQAMRISLMTPNMDFAITAAADVLPPGKPLAASLQASLRKKALAHVLGGAVSIKACLVQMGPHKINRSRFNWMEVEQNPFWCPDAGVVKEWETRLDEARKAGSSMGAVIEVVAYRRACRFGRSGLRQTRCGSCRGDDVNQCSKSSGDWRRARSRCAFPAKTTPMKFA